MTNGPFSIAALVYCSAYMGTHVMWIVLRFFLHQLQLYTVTPMVMGKSLSLWGSIGKNIYDGFSPQKVGFSQPLKKILVCADMRASHPKRNHEIRHDQAFKSSVVCRANAPRLGILLPMLPVTHNQLHKKKRNPEIPWYLGTRDVCHHGILWKSGASHEVPRRSIWSMGNSGFSWGKIHSKWRLLMGKS